MVVPTSVLVVLAQLHGGKEALVAVEHVLPQAQRGIEVTRALVVKAQQSPRLDVTVLVGTQQHVDGVGVAALQQHVAEGGAIGSHAQIAPGHQPLHRLQ